MLVLHTRANEKILLPDAEASIEIVAIQSGSVRLPIRGPEDLRVMREQAQQPPAAETPPSLPMLRRLLEARLDIARKGIGQARDLLQAGRDEDADGGGRREQGTAGPRGGEANRQQPRLLSTKTDRIE